MTIRFTVPGAPVGKGRPRVTKNGTFTPQKTLDYERLVQLAYNMSRSAPFSDPAKPLFCAIAAYFPVPPSYSAKKHRELPGTPYTHKPDADNTTKGILDALNGLAYQDDSQIAALCCRKRWGQQGRADVLITDDVTEFIGAVVGGAS